MSSNNSAPFLPAAIVLPTDYDQLLIRLTLYLNDIAYRVNTREISTYSEAEILTGEAWFNIIDPAQRSNRVTTPRPAFRKTFYFPDVAGTATTSQPHNLGDLSNFTFTHIYGTLNLNPALEFLAIPTGAPDDVTITVDAVNVNITTSTNAFIHATGIVVLEYLKN